MEEGHFGRHLRRMRVLYGERAQTLKDAVGRYLGGVLSAPEPQAGMHMVGWLPENMDDRQVASAAALEGIEARPLSLYGMEPLKPGLVLGFATVPASETNEGVIKLARAIETVLRARGGRPALCAEPH
ncbi:hypothetical protein [Rhodoligotrophos defluvii]|uniref:hypothetical protein n=1 Tax=Rhodoligotrophos defluvii TaxID=2561934 RepID=UPI0010C964F2|nr:hypothetical protein [Rhodoligotrophos defluvii]